MPISNAAYNEAFQITFSWRADVTRAIVYCRRAGEGMADPQELLRAEREHRLRADYSGISFAMGTARVSYAPDSAFASAWIDLYCLDLGAGSSVIGHTRFGPVFNGRCLIRAFIQRVGIAPGWDAVRICVRNRSGFELPKGAVGYRVGDRHHLIPVSIPTRGIVHLPQFECPSDAAVRLEKVPDGYPVEIKMAESLKDMGGE